MTNRQTLQHIRTTSGLANRQIAAILGLSERSVRYMLSDESGRREPTDSEVARVQAHASNLARAAYVETLDSWRFVPMDPTPEMLHAARWSGAGDVSVNEDWARAEVWRRMVNAAPHLTEGGW